MMASPRQIVTEAVANCILRAVSVKPGALVQSIADLDVTELAQVLSARGQLLMSIIGAPNEESLKLSLTGWTDDPMSPVGFSFDHAVRMRNLDIEDPIRAAIAWTDEVRLNSLVDRGYKLVGPDDVIREIGRLGAERAVTAPQRAFWGALQAAFLIPHVTAEGIASYYEETIEGGSAEDPDTARARLPLLRLFKDNLLFAPIASEDRIRSRLRLHVDLINRMLSCTDEDTRKALRRLQGAKSEELPVLRLAYQALLQLRRGDEGALESVDFDAMHALFTPGKKPGIEDDSSGDDVEPGSGSETEDVPEFDGITDALVHFLNEDNQEALVQVLAEAAERLAANAIESADLPTDLARIGFEASAGALALARRFCREAVFGGRIASNDSVDELMEDPGAALDDVVYLNDVWLAGLEELIKNTEDLIEANGEADSGSSLRALNAYVKARAALFPDLDLLTLEPLALLCSSEDAFARAETAVNAYTALLKRLLPQLGLIRPRSTVGVSRVVRHLLELDVIVVDTPDELAVLLTPVSPLTLWKHVEMARFLRERYPHLDAQDRQLVAEEIRELPEPLLVVGVPERTGYQFERLTFARRLGAMPLYRGTPAQIADVGRATIELAARKLAAMYPIARRRLAITAVNPAGLREVARALNALMTKGEHRYAHADLQIVRWGRELLPLQSDHVLQKLHESGLVEVQTVTFSSVEDAARFVASNPAHLVVVATERRRNLQFVATESLRMHPLSIPQRISVDPLVSEVELVARGAGGGANDNTPFGVYSTLIPTATGQPDVTRPVSPVQRVDVPLLEQFLESCQFLLVSGHPHLVGMDSVLVLSRGIGRSEDTVLSIDHARLVSGVDSHLRRQNLIPSRQGIERLITQLQELGGDNLISLLSDRSPTGFSETALTGQIALAVAVRWYKEQHVGDNYVIVSLDSPLANRWLRNRDDNERTDLLCIREAPDGNLALDLVEVKGYPESGEGELQESHASHQLHAARRVLTSILSHNEDVLASRRRELLRLQIFWEGLSGATKPKEAWIEKINRTLDREIEASLNMFVIEVLFNRNIATTEDVSMPQGDRGAVNRVRLGEPAIQHHLGSIARRGYGRQPQNDLADLDAASDVLAASTSGGDGLATAAPGSDRVLETRQHPHVEVYGPEVVSTSTRRDESDSVEQPAELSGSLGFELIEEERVGLEEQAKQVYKVLQNMGVQLVNPVDPDLVEAGPSVLRYKLRLRSGEGLQRIRRRAVDLMRELSLHSEPLVDNIPGTDFVSLDIPRQKRMTAHLLPLLERSRGPEAAGLWIPAGVRPAGTVRWLDVSALPHMLVAGATGSGKTMFLYSLIVSLARLYTPADVQLLAIDPKQTDFVYFSHLPHLRGGRVLVDPDEAVRVLQELLTTELEERTRALVAARKRDIGSYNASGLFQPMPRLVVVIDEFADLAMVMTDDDNEAFDDALKRLAARARNVGIHLVLATQRPTTDVIRGSIKTNLTCRISFRLTSHVDSQTILNTTGAEALLGAGDMLVAEGGTLERLQGFFISESDLEGPALRFS